MKSKLRNPSSGVTWGEFQMPAETAPLVYPDPKDSSNQAEADSAGKLKKAGRNVAEYFDQRAHASYVSFPLLVGVDALRCVLR